MSTPVQPPRTYNQNHVPRKYTPGKRRLSIYWTWSYPWEANRDVAEMDNRFSTMTEVRRVAWPAYETPEWSAKKFHQGIAGTLELFHRSTLASSKLPARPRAIRSPCSSALTRRDISFQSMNGFWPTRTR